MRPGVFDGGYAFTDHFARGIVRGGRPRPLPLGTYIVEAAPPPGYEIVKEEDKNVDFGDEYVPGELLLPPPCVGDLRVVPDELTLFPGVEPFFAGQSRPLCDLKQVDVTYDRNSAADFFLFTQVPKAARAFGFTNNDLSAEFNMASPNFGEKLSPSWIPVSFRDWTGEEIARVYADEYGHYNALLPSTFTMNVPAPSGVAPNVLTLVLNDPFRADGTPDPFYNPSYSVTPWTFQYMPGTTSYLDTPLVPLAAFAAHGGGIDTFPQSDTPVIESVAGPETNGGPYMCGTRAGGERVVTITSLWGEDIINPDYDPNDRRSKYIIRRRYGFGIPQGTVTLDGVGLDVVSWTPERVVARVPDAITASGRIMVTRGNGGTTEVGVRFSFLNCDPGGDRIIHVPADFPTIQAAIDDAGTTAGAYIFVAPGAYRENVIMNKPVRLQGSGAGGTAINGDPNPAERLQAWHQRLRDLGADVFLGTTRRSPFVENEAPPVLIVGETGTFDAGNPFPGGTEPRIDNFRLLGSKAGGGVFLAVGAHGVEVANNEILNNQGNFGGGVVIGAQDAGLGWTNTGAVIRHNKIHRNGGVRGAGGVAIYSGSDAYTIEENLILGNFGRFNGGGIAQTGFCDGSNLIAGNRIRFNETFFGALLADAGDGGGIYLGSGLLGGTGTGAVTIERNLIQGNLAGAGRGGGIRVSGASGADVQASTDPLLWDLLRISNNIIVNNVAGLEGGGISLQDAARVEISGNTIANNDATATSALAFQAGAANSTPQPAGLVSHTHGATLAGWLAGASVPDTAKRFSDPLLVGNILWNNRSFYNDAALNAGAGGLAPNPDAGLAVWDLQVVGGVAGDQLRPRDCIITKLTDASGDYSAPGDENLATDPSFVAGYENLLRIGTVTDEGGNAINVRYTPLLPNSGDYHLNPNSPAIDAGAMLSGLLTVDFDGDARVAPEDIGADEYVAPVVTGVQVLTPNGGERIPSGSTYTITWGAPAGADHYTVSVSFNGGRRWTRLAAGVTDTWLAWTVPTPPRNLSTCLVRVAAFNAAGVRIGVDRSDARFGIEIVRLLQPNGGEVILGGSVYSVHWRTNATAQVVTATRVQSSIDGGATWRTFTTLPGNPGTFDWVVPDPGRVLARAGLRIMLLSGRRRVGADASDKIFFIRPSLVP